MRKSFLLPVLLCTALSAADLGSARRAYETKNYAAAFKEASPLAEGGEPEAQLLLGRMYMLGQGVLKDLDLAVKWFKTSGEQGNPEAQFFLGSIYLLPQKDVVEGMKWMRLAAEQGQQDAQLMLGKVYADGSLKEVPRDPVKGDMWLRLAAKNNLEFYQSQLEAAEKTMSADQIAKGKALAEAWRAQPGIKPDQTAAESGTKSKPR